MVFGIDIFYLFQGHWKVCCENKREKSKSGAIQVSIAACFKKQASDDNEQYFQSAHSEDDPLENNEDFELDNSASALGLDNM